MATNISNPAVIEALRKGMGFNPFFREGKKLQPSFIWMGKKNAGKTWKLLDTFRGSMFIISCDNQTEIIVAEKIKNEKKKYGESFTEKNVIVGNFFPSEYTHIKGSGDERRLDIGYAIIKDIERTLDNIRANNIHFDYMVLDGYPELKDRVNEYMRKCAGLTLTEKILGNDLDAYGHRNRFFQLWVSSMFELSDICPIVTTYPKVDLSKAFKGTPPPEPEMDKNFMWEFRNVVWLERTDEEEVTMKGKEKRKSTKTEFYARLQSIKGVDFGEEGSIINVTGDTPVFPPEKLEAYRKGNPLNPVETPKIDVNDMNDLLGEKTGSTESEEEIPAVSEEKDTQSQPQPSGSSFLDDL